jgi:cytochrome c556
MTDINHFRAEVEKLRAEVEKLRAALEEIAKVTRGWEPGVWSEEEGRKYFAYLFFGAQNKARAALEEK